MYHAMTERKSPTLMKVICVKPDEKVVGLHLFGIAADEMMQGFGLAVKLGITKQQLDSIVAIHPTGIIIRFF
jgi:glutathione reductase (NADPH)